VGFQQERRKDGSASFLLYAKDKKAIAVTLCGELPKKKKKSDRFAKKGGEEESTRFSHPIKAGAGGAEKKKRTAYTPFAGVYLF